MGDKTEKCMIFGSVCSGIEAASVAWDPLGWKPAFYSEIDKFPAALLRTRFPDVPNLGDMTRYKEWPDAAIDVLVGGTPCQSFSVAGLRRGLDDPRGNLALVYLGIAERYRPRWLVWENVPGVRSSLSHDAADPCPPDIDLDGDNGPENGAEVVVEDEYDADESHAFACFLAGLSELGYGWAYRSLDAQFAGLAQRRERVFVVAHLGDWRPAAAVLFERTSLSGDPAPRREAGQRVARPVTPGSPDGGGYRNDADTAENLITSHDQAVTLTAREYKGALPEADLSTIVARPLLAKGNSSHDGSKETYVTHSLRGEGFDASEDGTGRGVPLLPDVVPTLRAGGNNTGGDRPPGTDVDTCESLIPVAFSCKDHGADARDDLAPTLRAMGHDGSHANADGQVAVAFAQNQRGELRTGDISPQLTAGGGKPGQGYPAVMEHMAVRRLTPREAERLQGFPDDWTLIPYRGRPASACPDGPRYKALGNSMAVPVMRWIGERIDLFMREVKP